MRQVKEFDTADGKRYRVRYRQGATQTSETFRSKRDAQSFAAVLDGGGVVDALEWLKARDRRADTITFGQWFADYLDSLTGITARTLTSYIALHRNHLAHLDDKPLLLITRKDVTDLVKQLQAADKSPKTVKNIIYLLSSCLTLAVEEGHIPRNPARRLRLEPVGKLAPVVRTAA